MNIIKRAIRKAARIVLSPVHFVNRKVKETNWYRKHLERNFSFVIIGSSTGVYDFDTSVTEEKSFNWSMQPLAMEYSLRILKNFFSILKKDGVVVVVFSPFSGLCALGKQGNTTDDRFFHLLDSTLVDNYAEISERRRNPLFHQPKEAIKRLIKDVPRREKRNCNICHTAGEFEQDATRWVSIWTREFSIADLDAPLTEENIRGRQKRAAVVQEIVDFCRERDLQPVFVMPPIHGSLLRKFSLTFRQNYIYSFMEDFTSQGVPFYDHLDDPAFSDDRYFSNSYFMSEEGARAFTRAFLMRIGIIKH